MAWYEFGTATVASGSTTVTLSAGATAIANVKAGDGLIFKGTNFPPVEIGSNPTVNTTITLRNPWPYATQTSIAYAVHPGPAWNSVASLGQDVTQYLAAVSGVLNSDTSNTIGTGSKTWNIQPNARLAVGARVRFSDVANPATNWMEGAVTAYAGRALTVLVDVVGGSGTIALWNCNPAGEKGATGPAGTPGVNATTPGTTVSGNIVAWNSTTGGAIKDSGVPAVGPFPLAFNLFEDAGRFAGSPEPAIYAAASYVAPSYLSAYNGSVLSRGDKFIFDNSTNGGAAAALGADVAALVTKLKNAGIPRRYNIEYFVLNIAAGTGTNLPIVAGGTTHYTCILNATPPVPIVYTLNFYAYANTGSFAVPAFTGASATYVDNVKITANSKYLPADGWKQITYYFVSSQPTALGYANNIFQLGAAPSSAIRLALPALYPSFVDVPNMGLRGVVASQRAWR